MVLLIGILYSLPNLYPAKPSIQATYANSALAADQNLYDRIENVLDSAEIDDFNIADQDNFKKINLKLSYKNEGTPRINGLRRISKPGLRVYSRKGEVPRYFGGLGVTIVSTSNGIMTHKQAWKERLGGEVMCVVW